MGNNTLSKREIEERKNNLENRKSRSFPEESWNIYLQYLEQSLPHEGSKDIHPPSPVVEDETMSLCHVMVSVLKGQACSTVTGVLPTSHANVNYYLHS